MDMESVINFDANVTKPKETDKGIEDIASTFPSTLRKKVNDANKSTCGVGKRVNDVAKGNEEIGKRISDADKSARATTSDFLGEFEKGVGDQGIEPDEFKKRVGNNALANILVDVFRNLFSDLNSSSICASAKLFNKFYTHFSIFVIVDTSAKLLTNPAIFAIINTLAKPFTNLNVIFEK